MNGLGIPFGTPVVASPSVPERQVWMIGGTAYVHPRTLRRFPAAFARAELLAEARAIGRRVVEEWAARNGW